MYVEKKIELQLDYIMLTQYIWRKYYFFENILSTE